MSSATGARRLVFVTPRYGVDVVGGSEAVMREAAHGLAARGHAVEIVTTCARDHYTWDNVYPEGATTDHGVTVRRFPVVRDVDPARHGRLEAAVQAGVELTPDEQLAWVNGLFRVPQLHRHLAAHARDHDAVVFSPYLFWTTIAGADLAPERTIVMPCLHDEAYARLPVVASVLRRVALHWYLSDPERDLAQQLGLSGRRGAVVGAGVDIPDAHDPRKISVPTERPFLLYAGRREAGKGWDVLVDAWADAVRRGADIDLVSMGVGECRAPSGLEPRMHDLGFVADADAPHWFAAAAAYVQPSRMESFSRTVMEAWLAGTPVLANRASDVVKWHCERSGAGVTWSGRAELAAAIELVAADPDRFRSIATGGRAYVLDHYRWDVVLDAMEKSLEELACAG